MDKIKNASNIYRIMDANFNRAREALRVVEDVVRFYIEDKELTAQLKNFRHKLSSLIDSLLGQNLLLEGRDSSGDVGIDLESSDNGGQDIKSIVNANFRRLQEALRTLEEFCKIFCKEAKIKLKDFRFQSYTLQKQIIGRFKDNL